MSTQRALAVAVLLLITAVPALPQATPAPKTAAETVEAFYAFHLTRRDLMSLSRESLARERSWLSPRLQKALEHELDWYDKEAAAHGGKAQYKPYVSGDVFTGFEEVITEVRGTGEEMTPTGAKVLVTCHLRPENGDREEVRPLTVILVSIDGKWLIDNLVYNAGDDLLDLLSRSIYDSYGT